MHKSALRPRYNNDSFHLQRYYALPCCMDLGRQSRGAQCLGGQVYHHGVSHARGVQSRSSNSRISASAQVVASLANSLCFSFFFFLRTYSRVKRELAEWIVTRVAERLGLSPMTGDNAYASERAKNIAETDLCGDLGICNTSLQSLVLKAPLCD